MARKVTTTKKKEVVTDFADLDPDMVETEAQEQQPSIGMGKTAESNPENKNAKKEDKNMAEETTTQAPTQEQINQALWNHLQRLQNQNEHIIARLDSQAKEAAQAAPEGEPGQPQAACCQHDENEAALAAALINRLAQPAAPTTVVASGGSKSVWDGTDWVGPFALGAGAGVLGTLGVMWMSGKFD